MRLSLTILLSVVLSSSVAWAQCQGNDHAQAQDLTKTVVQTAAEAGNFSTLLAAAEAAGLVDALNGEGPITVFAPTDEAFAKLPAGTVEALLAQPEQLAEILKYHVVAGKLSAEKVLASQWLPTLQGQELLVSMRDGAPFIDEAGIAAADIYASNGIIHVIDSVMLPRKNLVETAAAAGAFKTLLAAATAAGLADVLSNDGPFTIFAPTDEAFAALTPGTVEALLQDIPTLQAILKYHVVSGKILSTDLAEGSTKVASLQGGMLPINNADGVTVAGAQVVQADVIAGNGVIHVIDSVLIPAPSK